MLSFSRGSKSLFLSRTIPSEAFFLMSALSSGKSILSSGFSSGLSKRPVNSATLRILLTLSSTISSSTFESLTDLTRFSPHDLAGPGISRSKPPLAFPTVSNAAPQSLTTNPGKFHSSFKISIKRLLSELQKLLLSWL